MFLLARLGVVKGGANERPLKRVDIWPALCYAVQQVRSLRECQSMARFREEVYAARWYKAKEKALLSCKCNHPCHSEKGPRQPLAKEWRASREIYFQEKRTKTYQKRLEWQGQGFG